MKDAGSSLETEKYWGFFKMLRAICAVVTEVWCDLAKACPSSPPSSLYFQITLPLLEMGKQNLFTRGILGLLCWRWGKDNAALVFSKAVMSNFFKSELAVVNVVA